MSPRRSVAEARLTKERIVERGVAVASVDGLEGLTIGQLAADLGMSKGGVLGHFSSKQELQLAILDAAAAAFARMVWQRAETARPGLTRLRAACEAWIDYLEHERQVFPGGCLFITAAIEFDARGGPVRNEVARLHQLWRRRLAVEIGTAVAAGELPHDTDPQQLVYELGGLFMALNQEIQLFACPEAAERTRTGLNRLLKQVGGDDSRSE